MSELFSVPYFVDNLKQHITMNQNEDKIHAMNAYYRSVVSTLVQDQLTKNAVVLKRIQHLDEAYQKVKKKANERTRTPFVMMAKGVFHLRKASDRALICTSSKSQTVR